MQNRELNNGRLAMIAAAGMIAQELVTGEKLQPTTGNFFSGLAAGFFAQESVLPSR
jgi:hypothetical protein